MIERLDYQAAAQYLGVKLSTLRSLVARGQVPHLRLTARLVVFEREALDEWLASKRVAARTAPRQDEATGGEAREPRLGVVSGGRP